MALHEDVATNPIARFHEVGEYLIQAQLLDLIFGGESVHIRDYQNWEVGRLKLTRADARAIAGKDPANPHYLLRAIQREVFGDQDVSLTHALKSRQGVVFASLDPVDPEGDSRTKGLDAIDYLPPLSSLQRILRRIIHSIRTQDELERLP